MPTLILLPVINGAFFNDDGVNINGFEVDKARAWEAVDDPVGAFDDETVSVATASYVQLVGTGGKRWSFKFQPPSQAGAQNIASISRVDLFWVARRAAAGTGATLAPFISNAGSLSDASQTAMTTSYVGRVRSMTTDPVTGQPWNLTDFENQTIEAGVVRGATGNSTARCTQLYLSLEYDILPWATQQTGEGNWAAQEGAGGSWTSIPAGYGTWETE